MLTPTSPCWVAQARSTPLDPLPPGLRKVPYLPLACPRFIGSMLCLVATSLRGHRSVLQRHCRRCGACVRSRPFVYAHVCAGVCASFSDARWAAQNPRSSRRGGAPSRPRKDPSSRGRQWRWRCWSRGRRQGHPGSSTPEVDSLVFCYCLPVGALPEDLTLLLLLPSTIVHICTNCTIWSIS